MASENEYGFSLSINDSRGVDQWLGDGAKLNHNGDWIRLKGRPEIGSSFIVQYNFEKGDPSKLPEDHQFSLQPGIFKTIFNTENKGAHEGVWYNVKVHYIGPAPAAEVLPPDVGFEPAPEPTTILPFMITQPGADGARAVLFPRIRAIIDNFRGTQ